MRKAIYVIVFFGLILGSFFYDKYIRNEKINECINTQSEEMIGACAIANRFREISNRLDSVQSAYNFNYNHSNFKFRNKKYQENFMRVYADNLFDCKNMVGCELKDEGKGYYIALNNCMLNGNCTEKKGNIDDCIESYDREINSTPEKFRNLITATKEQACLIKKLGE